VNVQQDTFCFVHIPLERNTKYSTGEPRLDVDVHRKSHTERDLLLALAERGCVCDGDGDTRLVVDSARHLDAVVPWDGGKQTVSFLILPRS
jgi:hypothetical protein